MGGRRLPCPAPGSKAGQPAIPEKTVTLLEHLKVLEVVSPTGPDTTSLRRRETTTNPQTGFSVVTLAVPVEQSDVGRGGWAGRAVAGDFAGQGFGAGCRPGGICPQTDDAG